MSEQNILNPSISSQLNPDYSVKINKPAIIARWQARSGKPFARFLASRGLVWDLQWGNRMFSDADALVQWFNQYEQDFFSYADWDTGRYYSGQFADQPSIERLGNQRVNISAQFIVIPTLAMFQYPSRWGTDSVFFNTQDGFNSLLAKMTGSWASGAGGFNGWGHSGASSIVYGSSTTNDIAEWLYFGYGFRLWSPSGSANGIGEVSLDGSVLGTFDTYNAVSQVSSVKWTQQSVPLGLHRVKIRVTGTKNASSSGFLIIADAIEVMR
jgi:hypothetical protein